jgi:hypothetical protein
MTEAMATISSNTWNPESAIQNPFRISEVIIKEGSVNQQWVLRGDSWFPPLEQIAITYENSVFDDSNPDLEEKQSHIYLSHLMKKYQKLSFQFNSAGIRKIVWDELSSLLLFLKDHHSPYWTLQELDVKYGHFYVLDWIYGRWDMSKVAPWHTQHLRMIKEAKEKELPCIELVTKLLNEFKA